MDIKITVKIHSQQNHMTMQKSVIFINEKFKINMEKIKKHCKVRNHCHYTGEYRYSAHRICNLKYSASKNNSYSFL